MIRRILENGPAGTFNNPADYRGSGVSSNFVRSYEHSEYV